MTSRLSTGLSQLDEMLGGGLLPGTLTVVVGATGIGKTQLGLHFAHAGRVQEGEAGILLDLTTRGDSQNQAEYASRLFDSAVLTYRRPPSMPTMRLSSRTLFSDSTFAETPKFASRSVSEGRNATFANRVFVGRKLS